jgi:hypothetical protein
MDINPHDEYRACCEAEGIKLLLWEASNDGAIPSTATLKSIGLHDTNAKDEFRNVKGYVGDQV